MATTPVRFAFSLLALAVSANAADVKGSLGWVAFPEDATHLLAGGSVRLGITQHFAIEPEFLYLRRNGRHSDIVLTPNLVWQWRPGRVNPYLTFGPGLVHSRGPFGSSGTGKFFSGGVGAKVYVNDRWFLAPEFRIGWEAHVRFSVGLGYTWRP